MLEKFLGAFRDYGPFAGPLYLIQRALTRLGSPVGLYFYDLMAQPVAAEPFVHPNLARGMAVRRLQPGDPALEQMPRAAEVIAAHFAQPTVCLGAFSKEKLVGYMWLCHGPYQEDEVRCTFVPTPAGEAVFDFDFYIFPEHRTGLAFARLWDAANEHLRAESVRYSFSRVTRFNLGSRRAHRHLGWKSLGRALFLKARTFQLMIATVRPYVHLCFGAAAPGPTIAMAPDVLIAGGEQHA